MAGLFDQPVQRGLQFGRMWPVRLVRQRVLQQGFVAVAEKTPDRRSLDRDQVADVDAPSVLRQRQRLDRQALPVGWASPRHTHRVEHSAALGHQRAQLRAGAHRVEVAQRLFEQRGRDPAAGPLAGNAFLQQHQAKPVHPVVAVGRVLGHQVGRHVGRRDHLRQLVGRVADAAERFVGDLRRHSRGMARVGQGMGLRLGRGADWNRSDG